jgi:transposase InsO family protein
VHFVSAWVPNTIISDRGAQFIDRFWEQLYASLGTHLIHHSAYHPQIDGLIERVNQVLEDMLSACVMNFHWPNSLTTTVSRESTNGTF